ncbi:MAG: hypothetical protein V3V49_11730 [Candidatus Krumholzibacteria bacterium]
MKRKIAGILFGILLVAGGLALSRTTVGIALLKSRSHFLAHELDGRVLYEPGAENFATPIAEYLKEAVEKIERDHGLPFKRSFAVYVCSSRESFNEFIADPQGGRVRGASIRGNVFVSLSAFSFEGRDTHKETLLHELSHLHLRQRLGFFGTRRRVPVWFHEGLANMVAGSGGEGISDTRALVAILSGEHFVPDSKGTLLLMKRAGDYGLDYPMFHKQSGMFVTYIRDAYPDNFKRFLLDIQNGAAFAASFSERFRMDPVGMWQEFNSSLQEPDRELSEAARVLNLMLGVITRVGDLSYLAIDNPNLKEGDPVLFIQTRGPQRTLRLWVQRRMPPELENQTPVILAGSHRLPIYELAFAQTRALKVLLGIGVIGDGQPAEVLNGTVQLDLDNDGTPEFFYECTSSEGVHLIVRSGDRLTGPKIWKAYHYLPYEVQPTCTEEDYE